MTTREDKAAFDWEQVRSGLAHPAMLGTLLGAAPAFTRGLVGMTGGVGLFGALDLIRHRGSNIGAFFRGPLAGRYGPAPAARPAAPAATPGRPPIAPAPPPAPPR